jgi:hypothetical protein
MYALAVYYKHKALLGFFVAARLFDSTFETMNSLKEFCKWDFIGGFKIRTKRWMFIVETKRVLRFKRIPFQASKRKTKVLLVHKHYEDV